MTPKIKRSLPAFVGFVLVASVLLFRSEYIYFQSCRRAGSIVYRQTKLHHGIDGNVNDMPQTQGNLERYAVHMYLPVATGLPSDAWRPLIVNRCVPGMPRQWAPCMNFSNLLVAEEILYPDFRILFPRFIDPSHQNRMGKAMENKPYANRRDLTHAHYLHQHGRNFIFTNTTYRGTPPPGWGPGACMDSEIVKLEAFANAEAAPANMPVHDFVMFAASPDSYSFQHFMDRVTVMLMQTWHLRTGGLKYITLPPRWAATPPTDATH